MSAPPGFEQGTAQLDVDPGNSPGDSGSSGDDQQSAGGSTESNRESTDGGSSPDGGGPGFGLGAGLAALTTLAFLLGRRGAQPE